MLDPRRLGGVDDAPKDLAERRIQLRVRRQHGEGRELFRVRLDHLVVTRDFSGPRNIALKSYMTILHCLANEIWNF